MHVESSKWSGEGTFTAVVIDTLKAFASIEFLRIEDAPASHADSGYNFISNEIYVRFRSEPRRESGRWLGVIPVMRTVLQPVMSLVDLEAQLTTRDAVGPADYADDGMLQYLKAERVIPPYQTRGYKIVEMVRIYALGSNTERGTRNAEPNRNTNPEA